MKYLYNVAIKKSDGTIQQKGVLAADTVASGVTTPAAANAIAWAFSQAGEGAVLQNCVIAGAVDHDTTA
jgi:hypothetical protein